MTNKKSFVKPLALLCCLLILACSSFHIVNGQKPQLPAKPKKAADDYVIIEGDIQVPPDFYEQVQQQLRAPDRSPQSAAVRFPTKLWPGGFVPFQFDSNVSAQNRAAMLDAMAVLEGVANVDFFQCSGNDCPGGLSYVHIQDSDSNNSWVGMKGEPTGEYARRQTINIFNWNVRFIMVHELLHCLGFFHEQSRSNRSNYVKINCDNVKDGCGFWSEFGHNFEIESDSTGYGSYDFDSVMHYGQCFFSKNANCPAISPEFPDGGVTITVLPPNDTTWQGKIGQRRHLSELDRASVSFLYPPADWRFLNVDYSGFRGSPNGSFLRPYTNFAEAVAGTPEGGTLWLLTTQTVPAVGTYGKAITIKPAPGVEALFGG